MRKNFKTAGLLSLALLAPLLVSPRIAVAADKAAENEPFGRLSIADVEAKMKQQKAGTLKLYIYDNNSRERFAKGHLPGARWVDYEHVVASDLPKEKDATLVFYCGNEH